MNDIKGNDFTCVRIIICFTYLTPLSKEKVMWFILICCLHNFGMNSDFL